MIKREKDRLYARTRARETERERERERDCARERKGERSQVSFKTEGKVHVIIVKKWRGKMSREANMKRVRREEREDRGWVCVCVVAGRGLKRKTDDAYLPPDPRLP